ncbi:hypothetical protein Asi03nite_46970 [Actinoplanes siamensis]|uniref:Uncharacterized protein n=1 Tax=Actinoplanes siamensis TaxID=1223317 RepID=A0A919N9R9_9ACTN|nr:hypothetical protein Asi03nite_46970 [Actinoplanes siamensis]
MISDKLIRRAFRVWDSRIDYLPRSSATDEDALRTGGSPSRYASFAVVLRILAHLVHPLSTPPDVRKRM